ncbi:MAG: gliding motility-associated ABC transporter substrate-binding protein GldG [Flavobacteriales bacterium]
MNKKNTFYFSLVLVLIANLLANHFSFNIDLTEDKKYTLSNDSKSILSNINDNLSIKVYLEGNLPAGFELLSNSINDFLVSCKKENNLIDIEFINPNIEDLEQKENLFKQLQDQGLYPTDLTIKKTNETSRKIIFPGAIIYYKDKRECVNILENNFSVSPQNNINISIENIEFQFISTFNKMLNNKKVNIAILDGNGELTENELYDLTNSVNGDNNNLNYYYNVERFNLKEFEYDSIRNEPLISNQLNKLNRYDVAIIAAPTIPFNKLDKFLLDQYLMNGGKILLVTDGVNADLDSLNNKEGFFISSKQNLNLDDQLFKYGLRINSDLIQDLRSTEIPIITGYSNNRPIQEFYKWPYFPLISGSENIISKNIDAISTNFVSSIDTLKNNIKKTILLSSSDKARIIQTPTKISLSILENPIPSITFNKKNIPIAVLLSGSFTSVFKDRIAPKDKNINFKEFSDSTEIIVISDADIIRNDISNKGTPLPLGYDKYINYTYDGNKKFILNAIQYLSDNDGLINLRSKTLKIRLLNMDLINNYKSLIMILNIFLPVFLFILIILTIQFNIRPKYE